MERVVQEAQKSLEEEEARLVTRRVQVLQQHMRETPKSMGWKMRDIIGRRMSWYDLPEEVRR
ncbi:hypothetical protein ccbrp13_01650 [Ktedonobacteria bacterium brp13]|nr:hypothetical protein ccbrp13_01650 [Ktedonobacteria bacterium brp13]